MTKKLPPIVVKSQRTTGWNASTTGEASEKEKTQIMEIVILIAIAIGALIFVPKILESQRNTKEHNKVQEEMTPDVQKFGYDINSSITRSRLRKSYEKFRTQILNKEKTAFRDLEDLERTYKELIKQAKLRDKLMAKISGRPEEFEDE